MLLVFFILAHAIQAMIGIQAVGFNSSAWVKVIAGFFAFGNFVVILAQIHLYIRVKRFFYRGLFSKGKRSYMDYSKTQVVAMITTTAGLQAIFITFCLRHY